MNKYSKIFLLFFFIFNACEETIEELSPLVGTWQLVSYTITTYSNPQETLVYTADGENVFQTMAINSDGNYSYQGLINDEDLSGAEYMGTMIRFLLLLRMDKRHYGTTQ